MKYGLNLVLWFCFVSLQAQTTVADSLLVDVNFRFTDGLYADAEALRTNQPSMAFKVLAGNLVLQEEEYLLKVESLFPKGRPDLPIKLQEVDFICVNGLPYIRAYEDTTRNFTVYAGLRVRGRLCYFAYEQNQPDTVLIKAYNPMTGRPFRQQNLIREKPRLTERILVLATGEISPYDRMNMIRLMADDVALTKTMESLTVQEAEERLQRTLLIYDDRHPIYLPARSEPTN
jgi:hypothetical protein